MDKTHCPVCGTATQGNVEDEDLVVAENIVCKDPVCRDTATMFLRRQETPSLFEHYGIP